MRTRNSVATRGVILALLAVSLLATPATADGKKAGRAFYLTPNPYPGKAALTACAAGFHMASLWEIFDPSSLTYDTALGFTVDDSGSGPPSGVGGWIRTGFYSSSSQTPGQANCSLWTSVEGSGTVVWLAGVWLFPAGAPEASNYIFMTLPWIAVAGSCTAGSRVWCVTD